MERIRRAGYFLILLLLPLLATAQDQDEEYSEDSVEETIAPRVPAVPHQLWDMQQVVTPDSLSDDYYGDRLVLRVVPEKLVKEFKADKTLRYDKKKKAEDPKKYEWLMRVVEALFNFFRNFYWLFYVLIGVLLILWLVNYLKKTGFNLRFKENAVVTSTVLSDEELDLQTYEQQIQAAIAAGRFRIAVRLLYLQTLRLLADKNVISFSKEKTNASYLRAMAQTQWYKAFANLTLDYEYIWYGEIPVNDEQFKNIHTHFSQFMNELGYTR